jgi:hypothetical protein
MRSSPSTDLLALQIASLDSALHDQRQCFREIENAGGEDTADALAALETLMARAAEIADIAADIRDQLRTAIGAPSQSALTPIKTSQ